MFLRSNARAVGLDFADAPFHGVYVARWQGDAIVGVAAHYWNGMLMVQAPPEHVDSVVRATVQASGRPVHGISGAWATSLQAQAALGLDGATALMREREVLFALELAALVTPAPLESGAVRCRPARPDDLDALTRWRVAYSIETLGAPDDAALVTSARASVERGIAQRTQFVLEDERGLLAASMFNAALPEIVQIGGVWTPPEARGRGYARAVVAGSLLHARAAGVSRSVLFTGEHHHAARKAYQSLGYRVIGDYALMVFAMPR